MALDNPFSLLNNLALSQNLLNPLSRPIAYLQVARPFSYLPHRPTHGFDAPL